MDTQTRISCSLVRGGTSRGLYFLTDDLPLDPRERDRILISVMGGPDLLQIDGVGGGHSLTNKVALVSRSRRQDADLDYLFLQVAPQSQTVSTAQNCGNILAGVGPFAIENGLIVPSGMHTRMTVHMVNSGNRCELSVETPGGLVEVNGDARIDGVPGTGSPIVCSYLDIAGSVTGSLLPTGNQKDMFEEIEVTCIDNGMPVAVISASDLGLSGKESPDSLDANEPLKQRLETLRLIVGRAMGLGDVSELSVPKMCLISEGKLNQLIHTRMFIPHSCHRSIGVLGAISVATACLLPNSVCKRISRGLTGKTELVEIGHPSGSLAINLEIDMSASLSTMIKKAGVIRTARTIMRGEVRVPRSHN
ncbi:MAG: 4-oxalomesaconate tautomerase [Pseudomonadota bacterium]